MHWIYKFCKILSPYTSEHNKKDTYVIDHDDCIGGGGYGNVYKAFNTIDNKYVAIKCIKLDLTSKNSIRNETNIMRILNGESSHKNILKFYEDFDATSCKVKFLNFFKPPIDITDYHYIVMELSYKITLFTYITEYHDCGYIDYRDAMKIFLQLISVILFSHNKNISHLDIKLENILIQKIDNEFNIKLIDWGLAYLAKSPDKLITKVRGTHSYAAPEIFNKREYSPYKCDVWSAGVCLFTLLYGFFPFVIADKTDFRFKNVFDAQIMCKSTIDAILALYENINLQYIPDHINSILENTLLINPNSRIEINELSRIINLYDRPSKN